ncbi:MAG: XRE family transcriptional regulator [Syntrophobacteraceae bacterium]
MLKGSETVRRKSSANVFFDLAFPRSEQELVKAKLTVQIYRLLKERGLTRAVAAKLPGTTQPQVSALMRCRPVSVSANYLDTARPLSPQFLPNETDRP